MYDLPRHLRSRKHGWKENEAKYGRVILGIKKRKIKDDTPKHLIRRPRQCPRPGCHAQVVRMSVHLKQCHSEESERKENSRFNQSLTQSYNQWLKNPDSGGLTQITVSRHTSQVTNILQSVGSLNNLLQETVVTQFFQRKIETGKWELNSCSTYMFALHSFFDYLSTTFFKEFLNKANEKKLPYEHIKDAAATMHRSTLRWARTYQKESKVSADAKYQRDESDILTKSERKRCKYGKVYKQVKSIMKNHSSSDSTSKIVHDFLVVRNYIILNIFIRNAHRAAVVANMTTANFEAATCRPDGKCIIEVADHKTNKIYGNAHIIVDNRFHFIMKFYCCLRPYVLKGHVNQFILSREGTAMDSSATVKCAKNCAKSEGITKRITSGLLRKYAHTNTNPDGRNDMSTLLMHSNETAEKHYVRKNRLESRVRGEILLNEGEENDSDAQQKEESSSFYVDKVGAEVQGGSSSAELQGGSSSAKRQTGPSSEGLSSSSTESRLALSEIEHTELDDDIDEIAFEVNRQRRFQKMKDECRNINPDVSVHSSNKIKRVEKFKLTRNNMFKASETRLLQVIFEDYITLNKPLKNRMIEERIVAVAPKLLEKYKVGQIATRVRYMKQKCTCP